VNECKPLVGGLTSDKGAAMNGRFGSICSPVSTETGRVGVLFYSIAGEDGEQCNILEASPGGRAEVVVGLHPFHTHRSPHPPPCPGHSSPDCYLIVYQLTRTYSLLPLVPSSAQPYCS
jgi:hypothetical protein